MVIKTKIKVGVRTPLTDEDLAEIESKRIIHGEDYAEIVKSRKLKKKAQYVNALYDLNRGILMYESTSIKNTITVEDTSLGKFTMAGTIDEVYKNITESKESFEIGTDIELILEDESDGLFDIEE